MEKSPQERSWQTSRLEESFGKRGGEVKVEGRRGEEEERNSVWEERGWQ